MRDADWSFGILAVLAASVGAYVVRTLLLGRARNSRVDKDGGSLLVTKGFMEFGYWLMNPAVDLLARWGATPDQVTALSLVPAFGAGVAVASGRFGLACVLSTVASMCDSVDGLLARRVGTASDAGEAFDAVADRYVEFFFVAGLVIHYRQSLGLCLLALASMMGAYLISYSTAKAEAIGVPAPRGLMRRAERAIYFGFAAGFTPFAGLLCPPDAPLALREGPMIVVMILVGGIANVSAVSRLREIMRSVRVRDASRGATAATSAPAARLAEVVMAAPVPVQVASASSGAVSVSGPVAAAATAGAGSAEAQRSFGSFLPGG